MNNLMSVFVTGGAGFIGSHLVEFLLEQGHRVVAIDNLSTGKIANLKAVLGHKNLKFVQGDASTFDWAGYLAASDIIVHLASTVGVLKVCESALFTANNNCQMLDTILLAAVTHQNHVYFASTSEVYGESKHETGSREEDLLEMHVRYGGRSAYTLSKAFGEMKCLAYQDTYAVPVTIMRFFNTTGIRQSPAYGMVVPKFVQLAIQNEPITIFGDGHQMRSFCAVSDTVNGIYSLISKPTAKGIFNIGNREAITIRELAEQIRSTTKSSSPITYHALPPERMGQSDIQYRKPDISKLNATTGWSPIKHWHETIAEITLPFLQDEHTQSRSLKTTS
jgi:UDP-glucose 4-epimerase